jgi:hypothetical protein
MHVNKRRYSESFFTYGAESPHKATHAVGVDTTSMLSRWPKARKTWLKPPCPAPDREQKASTPIRSTIALRVSCGGKIETFPVVLQSCSGSHRGTDAM